MYLTRTLMTALMAVLFLSSCSNEQEKESKIETMTKEIGQEAAQMIKNPMDKAQAVADQETKRIQEIDERSKQ